MLAFLVGVLTLDAIEASVRGGPVCVVRCVSLGVMRLPGPAIVEPGAADGLSLPRNLSLGVVKTSFFVGVQMANFSFWPSSWNSAKRRLLGESAPEVFAAFDGVSLGGGMDTLSVNVLRSWSSRSSSATKSQLLSRSRFCTALREGGRKSEVRRAAAFELLKGVMGAVPLLRVVGELPVGVDGSVLVMGSVRELDRTACASRFLAWSSQRKKPQRFGWDFWQV